jgi:hypothetical protein
MMFGSIRQEIRLVNDFAAKYETPRGERGFVSTRPEETGASFRAICTRAGYNLG